jgi:hypothetical protein
LELERAPRSAHRHLTLQTKRFFFTCVNPWLLKRQEFGFFEHRFPNPNNDLIKNNYKKPIFIAKKLVVLQRTMKIM